MIENTTNKEVIITHVNELISIRQPWIPSSGFLWEINEITAGKHEKTEYESASDNKPGSAGAMIFYFRIESAGIINFVLRRPWDDTVAMQQQIIIKLI